MATTLKLLLDTNVLIAAYPRDRGTVEPLTGLASELIRLANEYGHTTYSHEVAIEYDTGSIVDQQDRDWRRMLLEKHPTLPAHPPIHAKISEELGTPPHGSNDWVDHVLLAAVGGNAVSILVTEDRGILRKARRLELADRVVDIDEAIGIIRALAPKATSPMLMARQVQAHTLSDEDPIFDSLRQDYSGFDEWLAKCKQEHRTCWVIEDEGTLAATTIVKDETPAEFQIPGRTLKIAMFKVSESYPGRRYGELLLKAVFEYVVGNSYESTYVTVLRKHERVIEFFENFGFSAIDQRTQLGEIVLSKSFLPHNEDRHLLPLDYHIRFGPMYYRSDSDVSAFVVPIEPRFHRILFPELEIKQQFSTMQDLRSFGNSILKAYLSQSKRSISPGSLLYFYRSHDVRALTLVGIAESMCFSSSPDTIASYVWKRTVYSYDEIVAMTSSARRGTLAILFRQARAIQPPISDKALRSAGIWSRPPQSIMRLTGEHVRWIQAQMGR